MELLRIAVLLASWICLVSSQTEDFAFEQDNQPTPTLSPLRRLWGIPDSKAQVGKLFRVSVPGDAFEGVISKYQVKIPSITFISKWKGIIKFHKSWSIGSIWSREARSKIQLDQSAFVSAYAIITLSSTFLLTSLYNYCFYYFLYFKTKLKMSPKVQTNGL